LAVLKDVFKVTSGLLHDLDGTGFEHLVGLDVDVAVGD
jgi:hypothetical protein